MKVVFIPDYSKENPYQKDLANWLSKKGVSVSFGITFHLFSVLRSVKNNWKPDVLHIHWPDPFFLSISRGATILKSISFIGELLILKLLGIKIIWTVHNIISHEKKYSFLELFFCRRLVRLCNKIIVHSPSAKNEVINIYGVRDCLVTVISHGAYIDYYKNVIDKAKAKKQLHLSAEDIIFLCFGQIRPYKGVLELIDAFKRLEQSQAKLLIIGKPLNNEVANDVVKKCTKDERIRTVLKFVPDDELQIYMNAADIVVLPYKNILTSGVVILAMSFAKPVIAPMIGCIPDILDSKGSFLYDPLQKDGLFKLMKLASEMDTDNLRRMGKHNFKLAKRLDWEDIGKRTSKVYKECLR